MFFAFSYFTQFTETGSINFNLVVFDIFTAVFIPLVFIQFNNKFSQALGHTICFFVVWIWTQQEIFTDSFFNTMALAIIIPIIFFIILTKIKINPVFLRGGIYSFWILNIFYVFWIKKENIINHLYNKEDAAYAIHHWWFMLIFTICLYIFTSTNVMKNLKLKRENQKFTEQQDSIDSDYLNAGKK